ncbi:uncharacterized protein K444DRAFT_653762 [Hyaloscypha bicolor E]|uniref:DUF4470 domain-containing protein n=1 Tax=Hyaloscypha bicolor E TaxID=1095630 RepID=A0A2J6T448_9HELO|nr:uncharacterized protein K444DRAFT_653762 [Hyaloscypha bicolor E]PMD57810.1 hypothetical protein K444DRAFT_653762 [Hyaloscypha bicolor E]
MPAILSSLPLLYLLFSLLRSSRCLPQALVVWVPTPRGLALQTQPPKPAVDAGWFRRECQPCHWPRHKIDCNSPLLQEAWKPPWEAELRQPAFVGEGVEQLSPHGQRKYLWGNVPAVDILNVAQNERANISSILYLLFAASGDLRNVVKTLAHLPEWCSGQREAVINDKGFDIRIKPPVNDVYEKIRHKEATSLQSKSWTADGRALSLILQKSARDELQAYLEVPTGLSKTKAQEIIVATTLAPKRKDYIERALYAKLSGWRPGMLKFRNVGPLLPFGAPTALFNIPHPTFFQSNDFWLMMDSASPVGSWPIKEIMAMVPVTKNDFYGGLHYLVSNIVDQGYLGAEKTLLVFAPILKQKSLNPYTAILTLHLNTECKIKDPSIATTAAEFRRVLDYFPSVGPSVLSNSNPVNNYFNAPFNEHAEEKGFDSSGKAIGLQVRDKNIIVEEWPLRLKRGVSKEDLNILLSAGHVGGER